MNASIPGSWECSTCTFINENERGLVCLMCNSERKVVAATMTPWSSQGGSGQNTAPEATAPEIPPGNGPASRENTSDVSRKDPPEKIEHGYYSLFQSRQCNDSLTAKRPPQGQSHSFETNNDNKENDHQGGGDGKWDAFAALEDSYQSSNNDDRSESDEKGADDHSNARNDNGHGNSRNDNAGDDQWDAFKSFEQNYKSSEEEFDSSSDEGSECSDIGYIEEEELDSEQPRLNEGHGRRSSVNMSPEVDLVDLVDRSCEENKSIHLVDSDDEELQVEMPGKENNVNDEKPGTKRKRLQKLQQYEPYTIDRDLDSSLSEVESRQLMPSPATTRPSPPWQRRTTGRRSIPIGKLDAIKSSDSFPCMNSRNDVVGGSGSGVNGFRLANREGGKDPKGTATKLKSRMSTSSTASASSGTRGRKPCSSTAASKKTKRSSTTKSKAAPAKRTKKKTYKRKRSASRRRSNKNSTTFTTGGKRSTNRAWSARERGIRSSHNPRGRRSGSGGGGSGVPYMAIAKQEPLLRNVGGASIQF